MFDLTNKNSTLFALITCKIFLKILVARHGNKVIHFYYQLALPRVKYLHYISVEQGSGPLYLYFDVNYVV